MSNNDKDSQLFVGLLIGGAVGIGALTLFMATRKGKEPLGRIGETILRIGEILGEHNIEEPASVRRMEKKIHAHEGTIEQVVDWVAMGINLWKKYKN
jgi:gas vesicle protein